MKHGNMSLADNYRGITLTDTGYKIYADMLGFIMGRTIRDAIYMLKTAIGREIAREGYQVCAFFADMKGAFDNRKR